MLESAHTSAIEALLFGASEAPGWLSSSVRDCQSRYRGLSLTEEFQTAINAFDFGSARKPFELFVVGEGKFGKSTLVNCLLGEELSRVRVLPETRCFLRYVLKEKPVSVARFFVRPMTGVHDWLVKALGAGREVPDLYRVFVYEVGLVEAKSILAGEIKRLDAGGYDPGVLEVERDVKRSARSAFQSEVRVVDTQGLDQLFPDELKKQPTDLSEASGLELFNQWMKEPRGKYLEWQFRRCDSVLWCVSAKRIGSAATAAALRYFSAYSKKVIVALTSIDLVAKKDGDLEQLLTRAQLLYGRYAAAICPVNGQQAWEAIVANDAESLAASRFPSLVERVESICIANGNKVRNLSRYFAIRRTERQYRNSLRDLHATYVQLHARYKQDRRNIERSRERKKEEIVPAIQQLFAQLGSQVVQRIGQVTLSDDQDEAERKVGFSAVGRFASSAMDLGIKDGIIPDVVKTGGAIAPYSLPSFDADGKVGGSLVRVEFQPPRTGWNDPSIAFSFSLESLWGKVAWLAVLEFLGSKGAREERLELERQRRDQLESAFRKYWSNYQSETSKAVLAETDRLYGTLIEELDRVLSRLEKEARGPLPTAAKNIEAALAAFSALPAVSNGMVRAIEQARNRVL